MEREYIPVKIYKYMNSSLVSPQWLHSHLSDPDLVILDATIKKVGGIDAPENIRNLRIPGALLFDLKNVFIDLKSELPNTMPSPKKFEKGCEELGITSDSKVIVYDKHGIYSSPRAWWIFRTMGHHSVAVLNGGLPYWIESGFETEKITDIHVHKGGLSAVYNNERICDSQFVNQIRNHEDYLILDARSEGRFFGTEPEKRENLRGGHIPNSRSLPYSKIVNDGKMIGLNDLTKIYNQINPNKKKLVFSCGSGITACVIALGAELAGHSMGTVYDGSWSDWGMPSDLPVVKGSEC